MESVGFKEWSLVCDALGRGEQSIILRKGGIAEGRSGFGFKHEKFFLLPTLFHEQLGKVRTGADEIPAARAGEIEISYFAVLESAAFVEDWESVIALEPLHILQRETVRERFEYDAAAGIHLGFVRIFHLQPAWVFPDAPKYGGCRSWVALPGTPEGTALHAVLSDEEHGHRREAFDRILASASPTAQTTAR
jgi:hypothetical protein